MSEIILENLEAYLNLLVKFIDDLGRVFVLDNASIELQQTVQLLYMILVLVFFIIFIFIVFRFMNLIITSITNTIKSIIESMHQQPSYLFYLLMASLLLLFTGEVSFAGGCLALFIFISMEMAYRGIKYTLQKTPPPLPDEVTGKNETKKSEWGLQ